MKQALVRALPVIAALSVAAFAQTSDFDAGRIADGVRNYILGIAAAGVGVLVLTVGLAAAWRYAKRFLKG